MRTVEKTVYTFDELSEEAKEKALDSCRFINVDYEWWDCIYEDAEGVGLEIIEFDSDRGKIKIEPMKDVYSICHNIVEKHLGFSETFKIAQNYISQYVAFTKLIKYMDDGGYRIDKKVNELNSEFIHDIGQQYLSMLREDYEYFVSDEQVIEAIVGNGYEFNEDGTIH